jgi:hypothetical protein
VLSRDLERVQAEANSNQHIVELFATKHTMAEHVITSYPVAPKLVANCSTVVAHRSAAAQNLLRQMEYVSQG